MLWKIIIACENVLRIAAPLDQVQTAFSMLERYADGTGKIVISLQG